MDKKKVSVVMCTYNGERYLREQIGSILAQTYAISELVAQDDCSTDSTPAILQEYARADKRVKVYVNSRRLGFNRNFSSALLKATGDFVACSDQDDIWREDKIEVLMKQAGGCSLLFHNSRPFTTDIAHASGMKNASGAPCNDLVFLMKPYVPGHECLFRREILPLFAQIVREEPCISYDTTLLLAAATDGGVKFVDEGLTYWRRHPQAASYCADRKRPGTLEGLCSAFRALADKGKRNVTMRYFRALERLTFRDDTANLVARYMREGTLTGILRACMCCCRKHRQLYPAQPLRKSAVKSFFTPLYFIRDCSNFVIH